MNRVFTATCVTTPVAVSLRQTMTNRRSKAKKSTSKPKGTTQPSSSKVKLTIPACPTATQVVPSQIQLSDLSVVRPVASTPVIDPPKASSPHLRTPSVGPESEDGVIVTPRPKTPPLSSIRVKKALENLDSILHIDDSDKGGEDSPVPIAKVSKAKTSNAAAKAELEEKWQREF